jgi:hypothetical protein
MNDELREAIRYRVTNYPRAHEVQPRDAREVRCGWGSTLRPVGVVCCDPVRMAAL